MAWVRFEFPAQAVYNVFELDLIAIPIPTPDCLDNILRAKSVARTAHQQMQQSKLQIGQPDFQSVRIDHAAPGRFQPVFPCLDLG